VGRYELLEELGRGGMGIVYRARDPQIDRLVAVKLLAPAEGLPAEEVRAQRTRFQREARAAGRLAHPNIVTVYDVGEEQGQGFLVMELLPGESLAQQLRQRHTLPVAEAVPILEQVAAALDYAHAQGIIHRDVKPANLLFTAQGAVKVADFGLAAIQGGSLTSTGHIRGTPCYMAPEQVTGLAVDGRADIFSLGAVLYEMLSGERAFPGDTLSTILYRILHEEPIPLRRLSPAFPEAMDVCVRRALAKNPSARYPRAGDLAGALRATAPCGQALPARPTIVRTPRRPAAPPPSPPPRPWAGLALPALVGLTLLLGLWAIHSTSPHPPAAPTPPAVAPPSPPAVAAPPAAEADPLEAERTQIAEERARLEQEQVALQAEERALQAAKRRVAAPSRSPGRPPRPAAPDGIQRFEFVGNTVVSSQELAALLHGMQGGPGTPETLQGAAALVTEHYHAHGYFLAQAHPRSLEVRDGVATLEVQEGRIGRLQVGPALRPTAKRVEAAFAPALRQGLLERTSLGAAIRSLSLDSGITVGLRIQAGEAPGTFDLLVHRSRSGQVEIELPADSGGPRRLQFPLGSG